MANFDVISDEILKQFNNVLDTRTSLPQHVEFDLICDLKMKIAYKVTKASDLMKYKTDKDVFLFINEEIYDQLTPDQQDLLLEEALMSVVYDSEKDKINILKPDLQTFSGIIAKYPTEYIQLFETLKSISEKRREDEEKAKADKAGKKKEKFQ